MDRLERLVNLVAALLEAERPLTRDQLRARVGGYSDDADNFRRNFERDKDLLRQMGMPLVVEALDPDHPDSSAGYRILREHYELADPGLADDELAALRLAASVVQGDAGWGRSAATSALWKLAGAAAGAGVAGPGGAGPGVAGAGAAGGANTTGRGADRASAAGWAAGGVRGERVELAGGARVAVAFGAVVERRRLRFAYRSAPREIDPWRLAYRKGQWYVSGWDHSRHEERMFRLDRVDGELQVVGDAGAFARPSTAVAGPPDPWRLGDEEEVVVDLLVDASQAQWAVGALGAGAVVERGADGSVRLAVAVTNRAAFRSFVLGFLDHAEVLGPPDVRTDFVRWLSALTEADPAPPPGPTGVPNPVLAPFPGPSAERADDARRRA